MTEYVQYSYQKFSSISLYIFLIDYFLTLCFKKYFWWFQKVTSANVMTTKSIEFTYCPHIYYFVGDFFTLFNFCQIISQFSCSSLERTVVRFHAVNTCTRLQLIFLCLVWSSWWFPWIPGLTIHITPQTMNEWMNHIYLNG